MNEFMKKIFEGEWFALIRTVMILIVIILLALADQRYFTDKEARLLKVEIKQEFDEIEKLVDDTSHNYSLLLSRLSRIEAQNEIILDHLQRSHSND